MTEVRITAKRKFQDYSIDIDNYIEHPLLQKYHELDGANTTTEPPSERRRYARINTTVDLEELKKRAQEILVEAGVASEEIMVRLYPNN